MPVVSSTRSVVCPGSRSAIRSGVPAAKACGSGASKVNVAPLIAPMVARSSLAASSISTTSPTRKFAASAAVTPTESALAVLAADSTVAARVAAVDAMLASWTSTVIWSPATPSVLARTTSVGLPAALRSASASHERRAVPTRTNQQSDPPLSKKPLTAEVT